MLCGEADVIRVLPLMPALPSLALRLRSYLIVDICFDCLTVGLADMSLFFLLMGLVLVWSSGLLSYLVRNSILLLEMDKD